MYLKIFRHRSARTAIKKRRLWQNGVVLPVRNHFSWTDKAGKRHFVYAPTLEELREKEAAIEKDKLDGIKAEARYVTVNEMFDLWCQLKRGLKNNTFEKLLTNERMFANIAIQPNMFIDSERARG